MTFCHTHTHVHMLLFLLSSPCASDSFWGLNWTPCPHSHPPPPWSGSAEFESILWPSKWFIYLSTNHLKSLQFCSLDTKLSLTIWKCLCLGTGCVLIFAFNCVPILAIQSTTWHQFRWLCWIKVYTKLTTTDRVKIFQNKKPNFPLIFGI